MNAESNGKPVVLSRLRALCLVLPETHEAMSHGEPTFRVCNKQFAMFASAETHHGNGRNAVWCKASSAEQDFLVRAAPERFFVPPYVGKSGWVGVWLDDATEWDELAALLRSGYRQVAPKKLLAESN